MFPNVRSGVQDSFESPLATVLVIVDNSGCGSRAVPVLPIAFSAHSVGSKPAVSTAVSIRRMLFWGLIHLG